MHLEDAADDDATPHTIQLLILPPSIESIRVQLGVTNRVIDILVPKVVLQASSIDAFICQLVTGSLP
jgi:hypothetical protein